MLSSGSWNDRFSWNSVVLLAKEGIHLEQERSRCDPRLRPFSVVFASGMDGWTDKWRRQSPFSFPMILRESDPNVHGCRNADLNVIETLHLKCTINDS